MATTIKLSDETKASLEDAQLPGESFDDTVARLLGDTKGRAWTETEIENVVDRRVQSLRRQ